MKKCAFLFITLAVFVLSCTNNSQPEKPSSVIDDSAFTDIDDSKVFSRIPSQLTGITFSNELIETPDKNQSFYDYYYNGGGVALVDINNDGYQDVFFTGNNVPNALFLNKGNLQFEDISKSAGIQSNRWSSGVTTVDINNDGYMDIYICNSGPENDVKKLSNQLYINNKNNTFTESAKKYGVANNSKSTQASFFDMENDGDLDLFVMNHTKYLGYDFADSFNKKMKTLSRAEGIQQCNALYKNNGDGTFSNITESAGIAKPGFGLGLITTDLNDDGLIDVYVANDFFIPDFMFINKGNGVFEDKIRSKMGHTSYYSMGCDAGDINNDGLTDLTIVDMTPSDHIRNKTLMASMNVPSFRYLTGNLGYVPQYMFNSMQINVGFGVFSEIGALSNTSLTDWSWASLLADFDNDGWKDYLVTNGYKRDTKNNDWRAKRKAYIDNNNGKISPEKAYDFLMQAPSSPVLNYLFKNNKDYSFSDVSSSWGFEEPSFSNGAAYGDLDNDGDLDLVINNIDTEAFVYRNNSSKNGSSWLRVQIKSSKNRALSQNAKVTIHYDNAIQTQDLLTTRGYQSAVEPILHFGLGATKNVDKVSVLWTDGNESIIENPKINTVVTIDHSKTSKAPKEMAKNRPPLLDITDMLTGVIYQHEENNYDDFASEILLPHRQSTLGPYLTSGDINKDGNTDFYVGGARGQSGIIYLQTPTGQFAPSSNQPWKTEPEYEDMGSLLFDVENDGDLDLYIASGGGGDIADANQLLQDRFYLNNGNGFYKKSTTTLPSIQTSTGRVVAGDYDNDGDQDLFVGGRTTPGKYPMAPRSYLLKNNNGKFEDVTKTVAPELLNPGMITDAVWADYNSDGKLELVVSGEWMPLSVFSFNGKKLVNVTENLGLGDTQGWWYSLQASDLDNDGDVDFIAGNIGNNNKFHFSENKPLHLYANDFDDNGTLDIVLSKKYNASLVPVRGKECSTEQMPFIEDKFPTYQSFGESSLVDIYGQNKLDKAVHLTAVMSESVVLQNNGSGFSVLPLPPEAQFAPIQGIAIQDLDKDGIDDLLVVGNNFSTEPETPQYDAGKGLFLKGLGDCTFKTSVKVADSGFFVAEDARDIEIIEMSGKKIPIVVVANNNSAMRFFAGRF